MIEVIHVHARRNKIIVRFTTRTLIIGTHTQVIFTSKHPARVSRIVFEYFCEGPTFGCSGKISLIKYKTAYGSREIYLCENNFD